MDLLMLLEVGARCEALATELAHEGLLSGVDPLMAHEIRDLNIAQTDTKLRKCPE